MPNFGLQIKPHQLTPLLATPRTLALTFAGAATYIGFIDPKVRNELQNTKDKLQHWVTMYAMSFKYMSGLALTAGIFSGLCYFKTKEKLWLVGGSFITGLWPYTLLFMMPTNNILNNFNKTFKTEDEIVKAGENNNVQNLLSSWVTKHRVRVIIALIATCIFYAAEIKSTQNVNVAVNIK